MEQEMRSIEARLTDSIESTVGGQRFISDKLAGTPLITAISGHGKVAAAATTATVIERFEPTHVIFGGVAGGIDPAVRIGDIVIADRLVQHDCDASPLFEKFVIPSLGVAEVAADTDLVARLLRAADRWAGTRSRSEIPQRPDDLFDATKTSVRQGLIAPGDRSLTTSPRHAPCPAIYQDSLPLKWKAPPSPRFARSEVCRLGSSARSRTTRTTTQT
jgi:adenosylhomocysteine nucleosidase